MQVCPYELRLFLKPIQRGFNKADQNHNHRRGEERPLQRCANACDPRQNRRLRRENRQHSDDTDIFDHVEAPRDHGRDVEFLQGAGGGKGSLQQHRHQQSIKQNVCNRVNDVGGHFESAVCGARLRSV